ncbi:hypothetical protein [Peristeroidobacter soli]|uniref:hypothetical protein n=1 Tax=Peristeroidobacter soli TaxID=2497877 RepID=UPI00101D4BC3|nr:hypothetical protein [Peristeroidobacter soli]
MKHRLLVLVLPWMALTGCGTPPQRAEFTSGYPTYNCPETLEGQVTLQAEVRPLDSQTTILHQPSIVTRGMLARRLLISVTPSGLHAKDRIVWSTLSVATFGGTFLGWDHFELAAPEQRTQETSTVVASPGQLKITRVAKGRADLAGSQSIDLVIMPGGVAVDDTVVHFSALWTDNGMPLTSDHVAPQLIPLRHPPGLDVVEATLELSFVVRVADTGDEWVCGSQARVTLIDRDSLRQPLWDLGLASANAIRNERLALFDPTLGAVRLVFDSPAGAHSFASWMRATGATRVGSYALSIFEQTGPSTTRPFGPVDENVMRTLRPVTIADIGGIKVGPAGEP